MSDRSFLILHGIQNHRPPAHWQFWLAAQLAERGHQVLYPDLPEPDTPDYAEWEARLRRHLVELEGSERTVVCHSLSCLLWLRAAPTLAVHEVPERALLVSPPDSAQVPAEGATFRIVDLDVGAVRASAGSVRIACSDADPYNEAGAVAMYAEPLGIQTDVIAGGAHITPASGYGPWASLLAWCLDGQCPITANPPEPLEIVG